MQTITYTIPNISCNHCVHTIKSELVELEGVKSIDTDLTSKTVTVTYMEPATKEKIETLLANINYPVQV